jgi:hypothetical protein
MDLDDTGGVTQQKERPVKEHVVKCKLNPLLALFIKFMVYIH